MSLPILPIWLIDFVGSSLMIIFSFLCVNLAVRLRNQDRENAVWTYLLWIACALAVFALSRGVGHIAKRLLLLSNNHQMWATLRPYSGAFNTITFVLVASITLFFERVWKINQTILRDKQALQDTHEQILYLNRHLEDLVAERTQELARSENKYRRIFESSRDMILVTDQDGQIMKINPAGANLLGFSRAIAEKNHCFFKQFFLSPETWERLVDQLLTYGYVSDLELELVGAKGNIIYALLSGSVECLLPDNKEYFHFLVKDITQRKAMEQQLLQADKLASIGKLAAGIAHEINNPLNIILGYTQLLIRYEPEGTERYEDLRTIEKHARNCKNIVQDLLSFSRRTRTKKVKVSLHECIEEVINVIRQQFELDNVNIFTEFDPNVPLMILDGDKMKQVFMNLFMNARQAIGKNGKITVVTEYNSDIGEVQIRVIDTGCGIKPHNLSKIFDPFFTTKSTGEGTGLGLSVSYGIVKEHGGEILVESEEGKGSIFIVCLPVTDHNRKIDE
ncbi:ATP-binding protein [Desulfovulcanus sp.]